ncbi:MAG: prolipoprotein diacylglyceryl transferase, partial [Bacteroides sp.]
KKIIRDFCISINLIDKLEFYCVISVLIGSRIGYCIFYEPQYYFTNIPEICYIWNGGLSSHGGFIGLCIGLYLFSVNNNVKFCNIINLITIISPLFCSIIRLANLINSEIIGKITKFKYAFIFANVDNMPRHPVQLYESLTYLIIFIFIYNIHKKNKISKNFISSIVIILLSISRFLLEYFKDDRLNILIIFTIGQILSIPFMIIGILICIREFFVKKK